MDLYHLRQGLHVIASSWDYHRGAESRVSVRGNSVRFNADSSGGARALSGFPLVPCPDCGMARVEEGRTQKEGENHGRLYFKFEGTR
jgi:hypothetical protein